MTWKPNPMRHNCQSEGCRQELRWQPDSVGKAFQDYFKAWPMPRGCSPTDIDGELEIGGCLFHVESKRQTEGLAKGQEISLTSKADNYGHSMMIQRCSDPAKNIIEHVELMFRTRGDVGIAECEISAELHVPVIGEFRTLRFPCNAVLRDALILAWALWADAERKGEHPWVKGAAVGEWLESHPLFARIGALA